MVGACLIGSESSCSGPTFPRLNGVLLGSAVDQVRTTAVRVLLARE
jgi:hypothetical protein